MTTRVADDWRLRGQRYRLEGECCDHCGEMIFPPRDICPACKKPAKTPHTLSGRGEVYTYSTKLEEGPMVTAQLTDVAPADIEIGMPVEMVTRRIRTHGDDGTITYGYKFRPVGFWQGAE